MRLSNYWMYPIKEGIELLETPMTKAFGERHDRDKSPYGLLRKNMKYNLSILLANKANVLF
jgi:hypothetical protein